MLSSQRPTGFDIGSIPIHEMEAALRIYAVPRHLWLDGLSYLAHMDSAFRAEQHKRVERQRELERLAGKLKGQA